MIGVSGELGELLGLGQQLAGAAVQSDANIAHAVDKIAPRILEEQIVNVPIQTGALRLSLGIDRKAPADARIGAIYKEPAGWRAHFIENGTATAGPRPFIRPAGDKYAAEFARAVIAAPVWKR